MTRRILSLTLLTLIIASSFVVLATRFSKSEASFPAEEKKMKVLRRQGQLKLKPTAKEIASFTKNIQEEKKEERKLEDQIPKHVPIKVKVRSDKEKAFKDLKNGNWLRDLELEVTNTSGKPIYSLVIWVDMPEVISENQRKIGFSLRYGRVDFLDFDTPPLPEDTPIRPGESYTFKIEEKYQRGWEAYKVRQNRQEPTRVEIRFVHLSFGDGTGFNGTDAKPYPFKRDRASIDRCREGPKPNNNQGTWKSAINISSSSRQEHSTSLAPAATTILPVSFFMMASSYREPEPPRAPDINCPGTDCHFVKQSSYSCVCNTFALTTQPVGSSNPLGRCSIDQFHDTVCEEFGVGCPEWTVGPCGTTPPTPSPSPSPSPSPTPQECDPDTRPNPSCFCTSLPGLGAHWDCVSCLSTGQYADFHQFPQNAGCDPTKSFNNGNNCCVCSAQGVTCGPDSTWNKFSCECTPNPTPIPTPAGGGGNPIYYSSCTNYYWVQYVSYDGGVTWQETGFVQYAGCY